MAPAAVVDDRSLEALAASRPADVDGVRRAGLGPVRAARYGDDLVAVVAGARP